MECKGVIEIIFISEILAKFQSSEDNRQWHHIVGMYSHYWLFTYPLVWAIVFIRCKAMREASLKDKDNKFPHLFSFICFHRGIVEHKFYIIMIFTNQELAAILRLAHAMANADGKVTQDETDVIVHEMARLGVAPNNAKLIAGIGEQMPYSECCQIVSNMTADEKKYVTAFLGTLICVDGDIDDSEMKLWAFISSMCDLPTMNILEAIQIMTNL